MNRFDHWRLDKLVEKKITYNLVFLIKKFPFLKTESDCIKFSSKIF